MKEVHIGVPDIAFQHGNIKTGDVILVKHSEELTTPQAYTVTPNYDNHLKFNGFTLVGLATSAPKLQNDLNLVLLLSSTMSVRELTSYLLARHPEVTYHRECDVSISMRINR